MTISNVAGRSTPARAGVVLVIVSVFALALSGVNASGQTVSVSSLVRVELGTYPLLKPLVVDGVVYVPRQGSDRILFYWERGSHHTVSVLEPVVYTSHGTRMVFDSWSTGEYNSTITINATSNITILAVYKKQYYLQVYSDHGNPNGSGWYYEGALAVASIEGTVEAAPGTRYVFERWTAGENPTSSRGNPIYVLEPTLVRAEWREEHQVILESDNPNATLVGTGWYPSGETARIAASPETGTGSETVLRFARWEVVEGPLILQDPSNPEVLARVDAPLRLRAVYDRYHLVTIVSAYGDPPEPFYAREGSTIQVALKSPVQISRGLRAVFQGWRDHATSGNPATVTVEAPLTLVAQWGVEALVSIDSNIQQATGRNWYRLGEKATISVPAEVPGRAGVVYRFSHWEGDLGGARPTVQVTIDGPLEARAVYEPSYTKLYLDAVITLAVVGSVVWAFRRFYKSTGKPSS